MTTSRNCDELKQRLDSLADEMSGRKPDFSTEARKKAQAYNTAFWDAMQTGMPQNILKEGSDGTGGYLVPDTFEQTIISGLTEGNLLRRLGTVVETNRTMKIPTAVRGSEATWIPENLSIPVSDVSYGEIVLDAYKLAHKVLVSDEMLEDVDFNLERYIRQMSVTALADAEEEAFFCGDGNGKPLGIIYQSEIGAVSTQSDSISMDDMIELLHSVKMPYRQNGTWIVSADAYVSLRKSRQYNGKLLWTANIAEGETETLFGYPILVSNHLDFVAPGSKSVLFGDFSYFWIGNRGKRVIKRLAERYADQGQVAYITSERVDAKLVLPEAVKALVIKAA